MKKRLKRNRWLSWLLTVSMVMTLMPSMACAAVESTSSTEDSISIVDYPVANNTGTIYTGQALVGEFGYYAKVKVELDSDGSIASVNDNGTKPAADSQVLWNKILESNLFSKYKGLKSGQIKSCENSIDTVTGATVSSKAVFEAVCNAIYGEEIDSDAFEIDDNGVLKAYTKDEDVVTIPDGVVEIDEYSFSAKENVRKVIIPSSVEYINTSAFLNCPKLSEFAVSEDNHTFYSKNGVIYEKEGNVFFLFPCGITGEFSIPDGVTVIGDGAFFSSALTILKLSASVKTIGTGIIDFTENLEAILVDKRNESFSDYDGILFNKERSTLLLVPTGISGEHIIPDTVESIGEGAFYSCSKLTKITLPKGLKEIPMLAFAGCVSLSEVVMPDRLETIGDRAFAGCQAITTFTIPENVSYFGTYVFANSVSITNIFVEEGNKHFSSVDGVLFSADKKTLVQYPLGRSGDYSVPDGTQRLDIGSFFSANLIAKVMIPDSVTIFGNGGDTPLDSIVFGYPGGYPANLMIAANKNSAAKEYAEAMEIPFEELSSEAEDFLSQVIGEYQPLFEGATMNSEYNHYWHDYTAAVVGESTADDMVAYMKSSINAKGYGENNEAPNFYCGFTNDVATITFGGEDGKTVTFTRKDGSSVTHTYAFVREAAATGKYGDYDMSMSGNLFKAQETTGDEFRYLLMFPDTPETTYHLEFRYAGTEEDVLNLLDGPYAYWVAGAIQASALKEENEDTLQKVISLFVVENMEGNESEETDTQRRGLAGTWDCDFSDYPEYSNAEMYIVLSADGSGKTYADFTGSGEPALVSEYTFFAYDPDKSDGKDAGTYIALNSDAETVTPGEYEITQKNDKKALVFTSNEGVITYYLRTAKPTGGGGGGTVTKINKVSLPADTANGSVTADLSKAKKGDTVTITVSPEEGYQPDEIIVKDKDGNEIKVRDNGDGTYTFVMPASEVSVEASFKEKQEEPMPTPPDSHDNCPSAPFKDVDTSLWYHEGIDYVIANGMMKGISDSAFAPDDTTTRAMIVTILYRLEGEPAAEKSSFKDVETGSWYEAAVNWAASNGIVNGYNADTFIPAGEITREQMATILYRYAEYKGKNVSQTIDLSNYTDAGSVSDWAKDAMAWAVGTELVKGITGTTLAPQGNATRAQAAALMMRLCEVMTDVLFAGGNGTTEDPWQIATAGQLNRIRDDLTAHYILIDDIDLSDYENWTPIGTFRSLSDAPEDAEVPHPDYAFTGTFDGAGHTISNLSISSEEPMGVGLFGCASGTDRGAANIGHFTLKNVQVSGGYLVGGAVGLQFMNCPVSEVHLVGNNKLTGMQGIGGIVGTGFDQISDCSATANITVLGDDGACAGLIAGGTTMSSIKNCEVTGGRITAEGNATWGFGALCGAPWGAPEILDCKASGTVITVSGENNRLVGGLVGFGGTYDPATPAQIAGCTVEEVTINVSSTTDSVGGLIGAGKEMMEGSDMMSSFKVSDCTVSGKITGGGNNVDAIVGDPACAVTVDCEGGMTISPLGTV